MLHGPFLCDLHRWALLTAFKWNHWAEDTKVNLLLVLSPFLWFPPNLSLSISIFPWPRFRVFALALSAGKRRKKTGRWDGINVVIVCPRGATVGHYVRALGPTLPQSHKDVHVLWWLSQRPCFTGNPSLFIILGLLLIILSVNAFTGCINQFWPTTPCCPPPAKPTLPRFNTQSLHLLHPLPADTNGHRSSLVLNGLDELDLLSVLWLKSLQCSQSCIIQFMSF